MRTLPVGRRIRVEVPASSANLGPGFDTLGLALGLYDELTVEVIESGTEITIHGEGADYLPTDESHLVARTIHTALAAAGCTAPGLRLHCVNRIPQSRGLGSSASAAVAGVQAAQELSGGKLSTEQIVHLSAAVEGHPDNSSASVLGGAIVSWIDDSGAEPAFRAIRMPVHPQLRATALVPNTQASTNAVRKVLPEQVPHLDARFNVARTALLTYALQHDPELLFEATRDTLHQGYRAQALPITTEWVARLRAAGLAAFVSGAGPTTLALHTGIFPAELRAEAEHAGLKVLELPIVDGVTSTTLQ